ncbi:hypothetical protein CDAR_38051 [Caerostris darwini]|uniref:Uncharacterized protein n=1 Tax=Caerostris darwini TaxID=1538125 RepID=A0AAV4WHL2_9ARAC|nr:hypothetical protein CDAR_38051 [Caerostris darwini]
MLHIKLNILSTKHQNFLKCLVSLYYNLSKSIWKTKTKSSAHKFSGLISTKRTHAPTEGKGSVSYPNPARKLISVYTRFSPRAAAEELHSHVLPCTQLYPAGKVHDSNTRGRTTFAFAHILRVLCSGLAVHKTVDDDLRQSDSCQRFRHKGFFWYIWFLKNFGIRYAVSAGCVGDSLHCWAIVGGCFR